jgi:hypothetical protein
MIKLCELPTKQCRESTDKLVMQDTTESFTQQSKEIVDRRVSCQHLLQLRLQRLTVSCAYRELEIF